MANTIQIKRSQVTATPPSLNPGELAYSELSSTLFVGDHLSDPVAIGGEGIFALLASPSFTGSPTAPTPVTSDNSTLISTTAWVKAQNYLQSAATSPNTYTKVTVAASGLVTSGTTLSAADIPTLTSSKISDFDTEVRTSRLDQMAAPSSSVSLNSQNVTNLATPVNSTDAATKGYVDASAQGLEIKAACKVATTGNITLSGEQTLDGVLTAASRVLVKNQTTTSQNGLYTSGSGTWTRTSDFDSSASVLSGSFVFVESGSTQAATSWVLTTLPAITVGTTGLTFAQFSGAGTYTASGNGITLSGTVFSLAGVSGQISISAGGIGISASYIGQTSITTLGTITSVVLDAGTFMMWLAGTIGFLVSLTSVCQMIA